MKKIITIALLMLSLGTFAQKEVSKKINQLISQNVVFRSYSVLNASAPIVNKEINNVVNQASFAKINNQGLASLMTNKDQNIEISIPYQGKTILVQLYQVNIFAEGFHIDTDKAKSIAYDKGIYYRGIIKGDVNSLVAMNFFNNELSGLISSDGLNNLVIGKLQNKNNTDDYIVYSDANMKVPNPFECHVKETPDMVPDNNRNSSQPQSAKCVTVYFEIDNELYTQNGSSTTTTTNWITGVFNNVQTLYNNDGITVSLKSLYIWTTVDPYYLAFDSTATSSDYLYKFNEIRPVFDGDLGQLLGIDDGPNGGVAVGISGLCTQNNYSYSNVNYNYSTVPTFSWTIEVITHELGHLMGSPHTHGCYWNGNNTAIDGCGPTASTQYIEGSCPTGPIPTGSAKGTIMSYCHLLNGVGISFNNGFGPQPAARILNAIAAGTCLSTDCVNTCTNSETAITITNVTNSSATITWTELGGATNWQVSVTPLTGGAPTWANVSTTPAYNASGLSPNTYYIVRVRPNCSFGLTAPNEQAILLTSANYCSGIQITDTGGVSGDYQDSETYVRTIIPNLPNKKISLAFSAFDLELNYDYLYLYDGNSTSAPDLSAGGFTGDYSGVGEVIPGPFLSTAADGSLTIKFYSDGGVVKSGYVANIACESTLNNAGFEPNIDFTYYPNPTNGLVSIASRTVISEVMVYNPEGRLLYQKKVNGLDTKVNMSSFANGTYFFKLKFNDKEANFKILKFN